jgi:phosphoribosylglycinamide formyltransferase-1
VGLGIGVLASGSGSNFEALARAAHEGHLSGGSIRLLVTNKPTAGALERARRWSVEAKVLEPRDFPTRADYFARIAEEFEAREVGLVCLAGFLLKVEPNFIEKYRGRILNIHPALLPKYGGAGMYGHHVHEAVLRAGEKESGCTVHLVDEEFDHGATLLQARVPVLPGDSPASLAARVLEQEHRLFPQAVREWVAARSVVRP